MTNVMNTETKVNPPSYEHFVEAKSREDSERPNNPGKRCCWFWRSNENKYKLVWMPDVESTQDGVDLFRE